MKIDRDILDHPKFKRLRRRLGPPTLEYLVRLWGHCESNRRGEFWRAANADYLEIVAQWEGPPGDLHRALVECGFVDEKTNGLAIHDWNDHNCITVRSWKNGQLGGRPAGKPNGNLPVTYKKPTDNLPVTQREPTNNLPNLTIPNLTIPPEGGAGEDPDDGPSGEVPDEAEVLAFCAAWPGDMARGIPPGIPEGWALEWWAWRTSGSVVWPRDWRADLVKRFRAAWVNGRKSAHKNFAAPAPNSRPAWARIKELREAMDNLRRGRTTAMMKEDGDLEKFRNLEREILSLEGEASND